VSSTLTGPRSHPRCWPLAARTELAAAAYVRDARLRTTRRGYLAVHWRRGDFVFAGNPGVGQQPPSDLWQTPEDVVAACRTLLERHNLDRVFLLTNEVRGLRCEYDEQRS